MRKLYSAIAHCNAGCKYCFTKWDHMYSEQLPFGVERLCSREAIVYPCCDGEFFDQKNYIDIAESMMDEMDKIYFSISTKSLVTDQMLFAISKLNELLRSKDKGFVKFSISISNKARINEIEPGTIAYPDRLKIAYRLIDAGIPCSLTLKPILPFIPNDEYFEVLDDFSPVIKRILIGGLYVCPNTKFYKEYIEGKFDSEKREVMWLENRPTWDYVCDPQKMDQIKKYSAQLGLQMFESDTEVIKSFIDNGV